MTLNNGTGRSSGFWSQSRRSFMSGVLGTAGLAGFSGESLAQAAGVPEDPGNIYYVVKQDENQYQIIDTQDVDGGSVSGGSQAEDVFQYAFDQIGGEGGVVIASGDTFEFEGPATMGDNTMLVGQRQTRFVASQTGTAESIIPTEQQGETVPAGHDLIRIRGDNTVVSGIEFDGNGTQQANQAIQADNADGVVITNNRTVNGFQMAISFTRCTDVAVVGNEVVNPNWYGITSRAAPAGSSLDLRQSSDIIIANNRVSGMKFNNIAPYNARNFTVFGNVVFDGGHSLIACSPSQQGAIVGNVCRDLNSFAPDPGGEAGIEIEYKRTHLTEDIAGTPRGRSYDITITGNQVNNCPVGIISRTVAGSDQEPETARQELAPYSFTVTGNTVSDCSDAGIRIRSGEDGVVATNTVRNSGTNMDIVEEFTSGIEEGMNVTR